MRFVRYSIPSKGYCLMNEKNHNAVVCCDAVFNEAGQNQVEAQKELLYVEMDEDSVTATNQEHQSNVLSYKSRSHKHPSQLGQPSIRFGKNEYVSIAIKPGSISSDNYSTEPTT